MRPSPAAAGLQGRASRPPPGGSAHAGWQQSFAGGHVAAQSLGFGQTIEAVGVIGAHAQELDVARFGVVEAARLALKQLQGQTTTTLAAELGYYDQAHFIKEFKNFYGVTPSKAFGR